MLSVIVPIYNREMTLSRCIASIVNQTFQELEIILVNDGSTDQSLEICNRFASENENIIVIDKQNSGAQASRFEGLKQATGTYIAFVDSDDWIAPDYFERLWQLLGDADIVSAGATKIFLDENEREEKELNIISEGVYETEKQIVDFYKQMLCFCPPFDFGVLPYMWNKIFKKELLYSLLEDMDKRIFDGEDVALSFAYLVISRKIVLSDYCGYYYTVHKDSLCNAKRKVDYYNEACLYEWLYKQFATSPYEDFLIPQLNRYMLMMLWKREPSMYIEANKFVFPYQRIPYGSKIIIYGAGDLGNAYLVQLQQNGYCDIIAVADQKYENSTNTFEIAPDAIIDLQFDYIVVSVVNKMVADSIRNYLMNLGVEESKIVVGESMR